MKKIDPTSVKMKMLARGIKAVDLKKEFGVKDAAISMALSGKRPGLLGKIAKFVRA